MPRRRTVLKVFGLFAGAGVVGLVTNQACRPAVPPVDLTAWTGFGQDEVAFLDELAETVIPSTTTPGAKTAGVGAFMAGAITECYSEAERGLALQGLQRIEQECRRRFGKRFLDVSDDERLALVQAINREQRVYEYWREGLSRGRRMAGRIFGLSDGGGPRPPHYFTLLKQLIILGYFTSEAGATEALRHLPIPGDYDGHLPYSKGDRAWSM